MSTLAARLRANALMVDRYARNGAKIAGGLGALCIALALWSQSFSPADTSPAEWARTASGMAAPEERAAVVDASGARPLKVAGGALLVLAAVLWALDVQTLRLVEREP